MATKARKIVGQNRRAVRGTAAGPKADRPRMPAGFGLPKTGRGMLRWEDATEQLAKAQNYWVGTTRPDGRPHVMPVWGLWVLGHFYFGTDRSSRKARNLEANPAVIVHLDSADDVVIVEGKAVIVEKLDDVLLKEMDRESFAKYGMHVMGQPRGNEVIYRLEPRVAFGWQLKDFPRSATRWTFAGGND